MGNEAGGIGNVECGVERKVNSEEIREYDFPLNLITNHWKKGLMCPSLILPSPRSWNPNRVQIIIWRVRTTHPTHH
jgi:hypothetical protein